MIRNSLEPLTRWVTAAALQSDDLAASVSLRLGIGRRRALELLRRLVAAQWLVREGPPQRPHWRPGMLRQVVQRYPLAGLQEDLPWRRDFAPCFDLPPEVRRMAHHAFTEVLNNAIDHSGGEAVTVSMRQTPLQMQLLVSDDGVGIFQRIASSFAIDDPLLAMFELSKGKLSSLPDRHRGHGLFYAARLADVFDIHANGAAFQHRDWDGPAWRRTRWAPHAGTTIYLAIALDTPRTLDAVLRGAGAEDGSADYAFKRTRVPLALLAEQGALVSRAEARRVAARLDQFDHAELDFSGIEAVDHGFADELFRVLGRKPGGVELLNVGAAPRIVEMLAGVAA